MCTNPDPFFRMKRCFSDSYLENKLIRFYKGENIFWENFRDSFYIGGGEPTISPYLFTLIKKIRNLFPRSRIICLTNARRFSYASYAKEFLNTAQDMEIAISIHGHNSKLHDSITRAPGSFKQALAGAKNIFCYKKDSHLVEIRVIIHKLNYRFLKEITSFIRKELPALGRLVYIFFELEGQAVKNLNALKLTYTELASELSGIYDMIQGFTDVRFYHFPLCVMEKKFFPYIWRTLPDSEVSFLNACKKCRIKKYCLGIHKGYLKFIGGNEFHPVTENLPILGPNNWYHPVAKILNERNNG